MGAECIYFWYDHCVLRGNGEAEKVEQAIAAKDFATFMRFKEKYGEDYFPDVAYVFYGEGEPVVLDIRIRENFDRIDRSEYECG